MEKTGLHHVTLAGLEKRYDEVLKILKRKTASTIASISAKSAELTARKLRQLDESPDELRKVSVKDLSLSTAILLDKARLLQGEATAVVEHRPALTFESYQQSIREMQEARTIELERDVTPSTTDEGTAKEETP
jgi:hypothetical protein